MNKQTIIRYLRNELDAGEVDTLFSWIEASADNRRYFNIIKNLWAVSSLETAAFDEPDFEDLRLRMQKHGDRPFRRILPGLIRVSAMLTIPLVFGLIYLMFFLKQEIPVHHISNQAIIDTYTPMGSRSQLILPDGSTVWLNSGSKLSYPAVFNGNVREVKLEGEAFFEITKDAGCPFVVKTGKQASITVRGTSFNLTAYPDETGTEVALISGKVELTNESTGHKIDIRPGQAVSLGENENENEFEVRDDIDPDLYLSLKDGILSFDETPVGELSKRLERWYGVRIVVEDKTASNMTFTGKFREESITQALEVIRISSGLNYNITGDNIYRLSFVKR